MRYCSNQPGDDTDADTDLPEIVLSRNISTETDERPRLPSTSRCSQQ